MLTFFTSKQEQLDTGKQTFPKFDWIRSRYVFELTRIKSYYSNRETAVANTNILVKLIDLICPSLDLDIFDFYKYVDTNAEYIARQLFITHNGSVGRIHKNELCTGSSPEIFLMVENDIDIFNLENTYYLQKPVRLIYHEDTALHFPLFNGRMLNTKLLIVEVDVKLLCMCYYVWCKDRLKEDNEGPRSTAANNYIAMVTIPNIMDNYMDIAIFNRFRMLANGETIPMFNIKHPFNVLDYSVGIDNILHKIVKSVRNAPIYLYRFMDTIPTLYDDNMYSALKINKRYYTSQSEWVLWLARINYIKFIMEIMGDRGRAKNNHLFNSLSTDIKQLKNRSTPIYRILKDDMLDKFTEDIDYITSIVGRR